MGIAISAPTTKDLGDHVWVIDMAPHQVRFFGEAREASGSRSIILVKDPDYDGTKKSLQFDADNATTLNVGTLAETVVVGVESARASALDRLRARRDNPPYGPGDKQFLEMVARSLPLPMQNAAASLLRLVRQRTPGDLKRGKARNFSESPDNFWYVIVQPQVQHLQITVRGDLEHFKGVSRLRLADDRGNTRFKVTAENEVEEALKLIFHAKRKK